MAPWYWAKESYYLTNFQIIGMTPTTTGGVVFQVSEDSFQVQEKGEYSGEKSAYLVGRYQGKWHVSGQAGRRLTASSGRCHQVWLSELLRPSAEVAIQLAQRGPSAVVGCSL